MQKSMSAGSLYPRTTLPERWWERVSAMARPYLKLYGNTINDLTARLDEFKAKGIDALEVSPPVRGAFVTTAWIRWIITRSIRRSARWMTSTAS